MGTTMELNVKDEAISIPRRISVAYRGSILPTYRPGKDPITHSHTDMDMDVDRDRHEVLVCHCLPGNNPAIIKATEISGYRRRSVNLDMDKGMDMDSGLGLG